MPADPDPVPVPDPERSGAGLYLHVPFCTSVCPYCDFAVLIAGAERRLAYLAGVEAEAGQHAGEPWRFDTAYLGGGTPSSLPPEALERLLAALRSRNVQPDAVLHLEVNPEDVTRTSARAWRHLGFSFVSLGAQSLDDARLRQLGRRHSAAASRVAFQHLREAGFPTVSMDLIYGSPGDEPDWWGGQRRWVLRLSVSGCYVRRGCC